MNEYLKRAIKYLLMAFILAVAATYAVSTTLTTTDIVTLTTIGTVAFAVLDMYCPSVVVQQN